MAENFDTVAFYAALNAQRAQRGLTWKDVASQAGLHASTLTRIGQGKNPDVNGLAALLIWSGLKAESFMPETSKQSIGSIAQISTIIRRDRSLSSNNAKLMETIVTSAYTSLQDKGISSK